MLSLLCNYLYDKLFYKPIVGQKRKNEEWIDYTPKKQMKFDTEEKVEAVMSHNIVNNMQKTGKIHEDEVECFDSKELVPRQWGSTLLMARQSIHKYKYNLSCSAAPLDKRKSEVKTNEIFKQPHFAPSNSGEIEVVKYLPKNSGQNSVKAIKSKQPSNRIFSSYRASSSKPSMEKSKPTFQSSIKKSLNFLQESYRLSEKVQYMQLLQQQTTKFNSLIAPFTIQKIGSKREKNISIPIIDLTKEKNNVVVDRSREHIPWTSSRGKSKDDLLFGDSSIQSRDIPKVNTLQEMLKTHPVTETCIVDEILSRHASETAEKKRQAEIEAAKLKVLTPSNRKAYADALEEKMRHYMRITTPALQELEPDKEKYVLSPLSKEQESKVSSILMPSPSDEVLVGKFGLLIKRRDLQTLKGLNWLNDEVINFYMNLIMERGKQDGFPKVYAFNTFFYPKLISSGHASLKRWTKKVDIFSHDLILVPIHLGMHWCMAVIDFRTKEVKYYDSMGSTNNRCLQALLSYLEAESLDKKKIHFETNDWEQINVEDIPQQMNGSDCGVFSCMFAEHLSRDSPLLFSQDHMPYFRRKMALEIVEAKLLT